MKDTFKLHAHTLCGKGGLYCYCCNAAINTKYASSRRREKRSLTHRVRRILKREEESEVLSSLQDIEDERVIDYDDWKEGEWEIMGRASKLYDALGRMPTMEEIEMSFREFGND